MGKPLPPLNFQFWTERILMPQFSPSFSVLPESLQNYLRQVVTKIRPEKMILFGSRARGDHRENSDFDIAVSGHFNPSEWAELKASLEEKNLTLFNVDLMILESLGDDYRKNIQREGKILYE